MNRRRSRSSAATEKVTAWRELFEVLVLKYGSRRRMCVLFLRFLVLTNDIFFIMFLLMEEGK